MIYTFDPLADPRWEEFLANTSHASVFHSSGWLRALSQTYQYRPIVFTSTPPDGPLKNGAVFAIVKSWLVSRRLVSLPFSDHVDPLMDTEGALAELLLALKSGQQNGSWKRIEFRPSTVGSLDPEWSPFHDGESFVLQSVDLRPGLDVVFSRFHHDSIQRKIRKAERSGIVEQVGRSEDLLQKFFALHTITRRRQCLPPPPLEWFRNILACMGEGSKIRVASKGDLPLAAILTLRFKNTAVYKYGCTDNRFHNLGAMPFLLWRAMAEEYGLGAEQFDLGRCEPHNAGLMQFKAKFGAQRTNVTYKLFPNESHPTMEKDWRLAISKQLFRLLPEKALVFVGSRIYRHIG